MLLLFLFASVVLINCFFYIFFISFSFSKIHQPLPSEQFPVSVLICAKNESENLRTNIPHWLNQDYPKFELILINDASKDNTLEVMHEFADAYENIKIVDVENNELFWGNKKYALTLGIKKASHKRLLLTDADCQPISDNWIGSMVSHFSEKKHLILGYGGYKKSKGILNMLIRFETLMTAVQYFSYALSGNSYMGVGRNMAYTSNLYFDNNGFMSHMDHHSGDDDLFVNQVSTKENTTVCLAKDSFTYSIPKKSWMEWINQKKRHITTVAFYKPKHKLLLALYYFSNLFFWLLAIATLILLDWRVPVVLISIRLLVQIIVIGKASFKLNETRLLFLLPLLDLFLVFFQLSIFISNRIAKPKKWK